MLRDRQGQVRRLFDASNHGGSRQYKRPNQERKTREALGAHVYIERAGLSRETGWIILVRERGKPPALLPRPDFPLQLSMPLPSKGNASATQDSQGRLPVACSPTPNAGTQVHASGQSPKRPPRSSIKTRRASIAQRRLFCRWSTPRILSRSAALPRCAVDG